MMHRIPFVLFVIILTQNSFAFDAFMFTYPDTQIYGIDKIDPVSPLEKIHGAVTKTTTAINRHIDGSDPITHEKYLELSERLNSAKTSGSLEKYNVYILRRLILLDLCTQKISTQKAVDQLMELANNFSDAHEVNLTRAFAMNIAARGYMMDQAEDLFNEIDPLQTPYWGLFCSQFIDGYENYLNGLDGTEISEEIERERTERFYRFVKEEYAAAAAKYSACLAEHANDLRPVEKGNFVNQYSVTAKRVYLYAASSNYPAIAKDAREKFLPVWIDRWKKDMEFLPPNGAGGFSNEVLLDRINWLEAEALPQLDALHRQLAEMKKNRTITQEKDIIEGEIQAEMQLIEIKPSARPYEVEIAERPAVRTPKPTEPPREKIGQSKKEKNIGITATILLGLIMVILSIFLLTIRRVQSGK
ncbi:hypothetical protein JXA32_11255 [Candidatus Sumerlaeota bacterium]|nr:hypothetical protein [Candidatus Sumerlaeota bacterium]